MIARQARKVGHVLRAALANLWGNRWSSLAAVLSQAVALTMTGVALLLGTQIDSVKGAWYEKAQVAVYLCTADSVSNTCQGTLDSARIDAIRVALTSWEGVEDVYFENREEAYASFLQRFGDTDIARTVTSEALPESFRVDIPLGDSRDQLLVAMGNEPGVETVQDQHRILGSFFSLAEKVRVGALIFAVTQVFIAGILLVHLVRTSLARRRREMDIMNLAGVSPRVVRGPYIIEIMAVTTAAATVTGLLLRGLVHQTGPALAAAAGGAQPLRVDAALTVALWLWLSASAAGWVVGRLTLGLWRRRQA